MIDELPVWASYDTRAVYVLTPALYLRLPGAASLKPADDFSRPIGARRHAPLRFRRGRQSPLRTIRNNLSHS